MPGPKADGHSPREVVDQLDRRASRYNQAQATANSETEPEFSKRMGDKAIETRATAEAIRRPTGQYVSGKKHPATRHIK